MNLSALTTELAKKWNLACEELTERQFADALRQALQSGDFIRHVSISRQQVVYIPYAREEELKTRCAELFEQRNDLLAACKAAEKWAMLTQTDCVPWLEQATTAIAKAESISQSD